MYSISEASIELNVPYKKLSRWIRSLGLGKKFGSWVVILSDEDLMTLKRHKDMYVGKKA